MEKATVLIVEDDPAIQETLVALLTLEGFATEIAEDGRAGLEAARRRAPDVILLDIMMPELDGHAVAQELRGDQTLWSVPIVFCSALDEPSEVWAGWRAGADSYVTKPFDVDLLVAEVHRVLAARRALAGPDEGTKFVIGPGDASTPATRNTAPAGTAEPGWLGERGESRPLVRSADGLPPPSVWGAGRDASSELTNREPSGRPSRPTPQGHPHRPA